MATVLTDEDLKKPQAPGQNLSTGAGTGAAIAPQGQAPGPKPAPAAPGQQQAGSSGQFQNLHKFIQANNPGQFGQQFQNKVGQVAQQGQQAIGQAATQFKTQAGQAGQQLNQVGQGVQQAGTGLNSNDDTAFNTATGQLGAGLNAKYEGPQNLANQDQLALQAQQAGAIGNAAGTDSGRFALLQKFFNKPTYNAGQGRLDNLLLSGQTGALNQVRQQGRQVGSQLSQAQQEAAAQAGSLGQQATDIQNQAQGLGSNVATGLEGGLKADASKWLDEAGAFNDPNSVKRAFIDQNQKYGPGGWAHGTLNIGGTALNTDQLAKLVDSGMAGVQGGSLDSAALAKLKASGDLSSLYGNTSAEAQGQAGRFNKLAGLLKTGKSYGGGSLLNKGTIGLSDQARGDLESRVGSEGQAIADQGMAAAVDKANNAKTDELFRTKYAGQQAENDARAQSGYKGEMTPELQAQIAERTQAILAAGGKSNWAGDQARAEGNAYAKSLNDQTSQAGQDFRKQQVAKANAEALKRVLGV
jgi:hypothetical protein